MKRCAAALSRFSRPRAGEGYVVLKRERPKQQPMLVAPLTAARLRPPIKAGLDYLRQQPPRVCRLSVLSQLRRR